MIVIVGAGPVGLHAAENIGECLVLEEDKEIGLPVQCAGLINKSGLEELGVLDKSYIQNEVFGADFFSQNESFSVSRQQPVASVVSRQKFDQFLAQRAEKAGAEIRTNSKVKKIERSGKQWVLHTSSEQIKADFLILACGCSRLANQVGLEPYKPEQFLRTAQVETECDMPSEKVELHFGSVAPGFFAWRIPTNDTVRVGLGTTGAPKPLLDAFLKRFDCKPLENSGGLIPIQGPLEKTQGENVLLLGDAAGQVKPTTGGGIVTGLTCAKIASKVALASAEGQEMNYDKLWRDELAHEFNLGLMIHKVNESLSDEKFDELFRLIKDESLDRLLELYGHMDKPSYLLEAFKEKPEVVSKLFSLVK